MKIEGKSRGGKRDGTCDHDLSRSWNVEVCKTKQNKKSRQSPLFDRRQACLATGEGDTNH